MRKVRPIRQPDGKRRKKAKPVKVPVSLDGYEQKDMKVFFPESCCLWKSRRDATWRCQVKNWPCSFSRSVVKYGHTRSLRLLMTEAWHAWSILEGVEWKDVPMHGLLELDEMFSSSDV